MSILQERVTRDTIIPLQPIDGGVSNVVVFPRANPPVLRKVTWTPAIDTVVVGLRSPISLDLRVVIFDGPFAETVALFEQHLSNAVSVWRDEGMGVRAGDIEIIDRTEDNSGFHVSREETCERDGSGGGHDRIRILYVHSIEGGPAGHACILHTVYIATSFPGAVPMVLAHEIGHLFGLRHTPWGVMNNEGSGGRTFTEGQIFRAHFSANSVLNLVFDAHPREVRRNCLSRPAQCLPISYVLR